MNAEELLRHYERVADAPDAIARLRQFVLNLAVRGKLVQRDPSDGSGLELAARLAVEKRRLTKAGVIKNGDSPSLISPAELPLDTPSHWAWVRLRDIGRISGGMTPSMNRADYWGGDVVWLSPKDIKADEATDSELKITAKGLAETRLEAFPAGSLFIVARSGILKRTLPVAINRVAAAANQDMKVLVPFEPGMERYLQIMFRGMTDWVLRELVKTGTTVQSLKYAEFEVQAFPIPPLAEQHRIVAKVDELMALCDRLEAGRAERETARDRLAAVTLARLNTPDPETFADDVRFALDALPALTARPDQSKLLRKTIIDLAVRGKLVTQDPLDEPASVLLARIHSDVQAFAMRNRLGMPVAEPIDASDEPFDVPACWRWVRLAELFRVITDGDHQPPPRADDGVAFLTIGNVTTGSLDFTGCRLVPKEYFSSLAPYRTPARGDILYTVVGATFGRPALVETDREFCVQRHIAILKPAFDMSLQYLVLLLSSPLIYDQAVRSITGTAQPTIALRPLRRFMAPVPPRAEQDRIVAKVQELMTVCDQLEASLLAGVEHRSRLLEVLLRITVESGNHADAPARVDEAAA